jgi:hypothetical protein
LPVRLPDITIEIEQMFELMILTVASAMPLLSRLAPARARLPAAAATAWRGIAWKARAG